MSRLAALCALALALLAAAPAAATPIGAMHGTLLGALPPRTPVDLYIRLVGAHDAEIDAFVAALNAPNSPAYGRYLTPQQWGAYFGAVPATYARAIAMLRLHGFTIDDLPENRTDIIAHAPASIVAAFFRTPIDLRVERGRIFFANRYEPIVPSALHAAAISGLDDYGLHHSMLRQRPQRRINGSFSWGPQDVAAAYDLNPLYQANPVLDGKGVTIANATSGAATTGDLALFQKTFGLPPAQLVSTAIGGPLSPNGNGESSLDVDWALSVAREATFHQVVASKPSNHQFDLVYDYIVNKLGSTVHVVTTSWGICEHDIQHSPSVTIDEKLFAQAAAEGQWWFAASGDNGTDDCDDGYHKVSVDFPGSSPYVVSVGGTNVKASIVAGNVVAWKGESTWQFSNSDGASGGGRSVLYPKPAYQKALTPNDGTRDVPDVSLIADNINDGLWMVDNGGVQGGNGGTSEAAPQWAGLLAIVEQRYANKRITDPHVRLYQLAGTKTYPSVMHDIRVGNNGVPPGVDPYGTFPGYNAGRGFDLATGLGSFIGAALVRAY